MRTSKDHIDYWKAKLRKQKVPRNEWEGGARNVDWEIYLQFRGRREWFNLHSANREIAAASAREIWRTLVGAGWDEAHKRYKPAVTKIITSPTVGEFLAAAEQYGSLKPMTLRTYARKLRGLVAAVRGLNEDVKKFDAQNGGAAAWKAQIDGVKLSSLTLFAVQEWKKSVLRRAGGNPLSEVRARRTINSILRNVKSLLSPRFLKLLPIQLPDPPPLADVDFEKVGKPRYRSHVNVESLLQAASAELKEANPEAYKVFLLAMTVGLRRREIDGLQWSQIDFDGLKIRIETTQYTELKSQDSEDTVDIPAFVGAALKEMHTASFQPFVVTGLPEWHGSSKGATFAYRCNQVFGRLIQWLRAHGINDDKPIHLLRKEFGSHIADKHGIFAASHALRHASITTTRDHYLDKKSPIVFGFQPKTADAV